MSFFIAIAAALFLLAGIVCFTLAIWRKYRCPQCGSWESRIERERFIDHIGWYMKLSEFPFEFPQYCNIKKRVCEHCEHLMDEQTWFSDFPADQEAYTVFMGRVLKKDPANPVTLEEDRH